MSIAYRIEPYGGDVVDATAWRSPGDPDMNYQLPDWRFARSPHGPGPFAVARQEGVIGGMIAVVSTAPTGRGGPVPDFWASNTIVDPHMRGKFVFMRMGKLVVKYCAGQGAMLWRFPNAQAARGWFGRLEWKRTGNARYVAVRRRWVASDGPCDRRLSRGRPVRLPEILDSFGKVNPLSVGKVHEENMTIERPYPRQGGLQ